MVMPTFKSAHTKGMQAKGTGMPRARVTTQRATLMESQMQKEMTTKKMITSGDPMRLRFSCISIILLPNLAGKDVLHAGKLCGEAVRKALAAQQYHQEDAERDHADDHVNPLRHPLREACPREKEKGHQQKPCQVEEPVEKDGGQRIGEGEFFLAGEHIGAGGLPQPQRQYIVDEHADEQGYKGLPETHIRPRDLRPPERGQTDRRPDEDQGQEGEERVCLPEGCPDLSELDAPERKIEEDNAHREAEDGDKCAFFHKPTHYSVC